MKSFALLGILLLAPLALAQHHNDLSWSVGVCPAGQTCGATTGFNIKSSTTTGGPYTAIQSVPVTTLIFSDTATGRLIEGKHNFYVVTATGPGGESTPTNEIDMLTPFSGPATPGQLSGTPH